MTFVFADFETRCKLELSEVGQDRYVGEAEVLMVGVGFEDGSVMIRPGLGIAAGVTFVSWGGFDREIARRVEKLDCPDWIDARILAQMVGLPASLEAFCCAIGIPAKKDPRGTRLINKYSKPQEDGTFREMTPEDRKAMEEYCLQDVRLLQQAWRFLAPLVPEWRRKHQAAWESYDKMNRRGVPIDVEGCKKAQKLIEEQVSRIEGECRERFGFTTTQTAKVCEFLGTENVERQTLEGYKTKDPDQRWVCDARLITSRAAAKKLVPMISMAGEDGRIRSAFHYHGAHTGRGTSMGVQFQNLKKGVVDLDFFYKLHTDYPIADPLQQTQANIRGFIAAKEGKQLVIVDYSQVEARLLSWIAGESYLTEAFVSGRDIYKEFAASVYGTAIGEVTDMQRSHGKATVLGCFGPETLVLTNRGFIAIDSISATDKLWDGEEWVWHQGVIPQGEKEVIQFGGVSATPDHLFLVDGMWTPWSEVCENPQILQWALESASSPWSAGSDRSSAVALSGGPPVNAPAAGLVSLAGTISEQGDLPGVMGVRRRRQRRLNPGNTGGTSTFVRMMRYARDCSIAFQRALADATTPKILSSGTTAGGEFWCLRSGGTHTVAANRTIDEIRWLGGASFSLICSRFRGLMTRALSWIGLTTIAGMSQGISGLSVEKRTWTTGGPSETCSSGFTSLKRKSQTFDIANVGPRNRYTILTNHGLLIAHNCGYGMGPKKLIIQAGTMGTIIPPRAAGELVERYRKSYPAIPMLWQSIDVGIKGLIKGRHEVFNAGRCTFTINPSRTMLRIELPSGRVLRYFKPRVDSENRIVYQGRHGLVHCWGGHFVENVCQAIAGDLKTDFMIRADEANFHAVMEVHDELVFEEYEEIAELVLRESLGMMAQTPEWLDCPGLIKGEGKILPRFSK